MKKSFVFLLVCILVLLPLTALAENTYSVSIETPVKMSLVSETNGNYEYSVTANVNVKEGNTPVSKQVSLIMFGSKDNTEFVSGDSLLNLTINQIAQDYYIYYLDQLQSNENGTATFEFNVILPTPAVADKYYVWASTESNTTPEQISKEDLSVSGEIFDLSVSLESQTVTAGNNVEIIPSYNDLFGAQISSDNASVEYFIKKNNNSVSGVIIGNTINTSTLSGTYEVYGVLTRKDGTFATSESVSLTVNKSEQNPEILLGDVNYDGYISTFDAVYVLSAIAGTINLEDSQMDAADTDGDNRLTVTDATQILRYVARIINSFN